MNTEATDRPKRMFFNTLCDIVDGHRALMSANPTPQAIQAARQELQAQFRGLVLSMGYVDKSETAGLAPKAETVQSAVQETVQKAAPAYRSRATKMDGEAEETCEECGYHGRPRYPASCKTCRNRYARIAAAEKRRAKEVPVRVMPPEGKRVCDRKCADCGEICYGERCRKCAAKAGSYARIRNRKSADTPIVDQAIQASAQFVQAIAKQAVAPAPTPPPAPVHPSYPLPLIFDAIERGKRLHKEVGFAVVVRRTRDGDLYRPTPLNEMFADGERAIVHFEWEKSNKTWIPMSPPLAHDRELVQVIAAREKRASGVGMAASKEEAANYAHAA